MPQFGQPGKLSRGKPNHSPEPRISRTVAMLASACGEEPCEASFRKAKACYEQLECVEKIQYPDLYYNCGFFQHVDFEAVRNAEGYFCNAEDAAVYAVCELDPTNCTCL